MLKVGQSVVLSTLSSGQEPGNFIAYVWSMWDGSTVVTREGLLRAVVNRENVSVSVSACDVYGQKSTSTYTPTTTSPLPSVPSFSLSVAQQVLPFIANLSISPGPGCTADWYDSVGNHLATGLTTSIEVVSEDLSYFRVRVYSPGDTASYIDIFFNLSGVENQAPVSSPLNSNLMPVAYSNFVAPALVATTAEISLYGGVQTIDGIQTVGEWFLSGGTYYRYAGPSRVLVKNQSNASQNGLYNTTSDVIWTYVIGSSLSAGRITINSSSTAAFFSILDSTSVSTSNLLAKYLVVGKKFKIYQSGGGTQEYSITGVTAITGGYSLTISLLSSTGLLISGVNSSVYFGWTRTTDSIPAGTTVRVLSGTANGGFSFAARLQNVLRTAILDSDKIFWLRLGDYTGTATPGGVKYVDGTVNEPDDQVVISTIDAVGIETALVFSGSDQALVRVKIPTATLDPGPYTVIESHQDQGNSEDFVSLTTTRRLAFTVN